MDTEGNKLIAEFVKTKIDGDWYLIPYLQSTMKTGWYQVERMQFHSSWDWQIPAWSKAAKLVKEKANKNGRHVDFYFSQLEQYEKAIINDDKLYGFQVVIKSIQWYNQNK